MSSLQGKHVNPKYALKMSLHPEAHDDTLPVSWNQTLACILTLQGLGGGGKVGCMKLSHAK